MTTALTTTPHHYYHDDPSHPEQAARLNALFKALDHSGLREQTLQLEHEPATLDQIRAVHSARMTDQMRRAADEGGMWLNLDTYTTFGSWDAALSAAGAALRATEAVVRGEAQNAFALVRPPGHHATMTQSMGFCMFNNIAVAARHAVSTLGMERVAIIDFDVHHGNGTQDIFYNDSQVLFCSSHAYGTTFYPGTGSMREVGEGVGMGTTLNLPLTYGVDDTGLLRLYDEIVLPAVRDFHPQLILVSAGYDGHWADPLGPLSCSVSGYAALTQRLMALAAEVCERRLVYVLEGGYDLQALCASVLASLRVLLGQDPGDDPLGPSDTHGPDVSALIARLNESHPFLRGYTGGASRWF